MFIISRISSVRSNIIANYIGKGWEAAMGLAFVPLYISYLGPEAFGIVAFVALVQAFMGVLDLGMTPTLTRETARYETKTSDSVRIRDLLRSVEILTLFVSTVIFLLFAMTSPIIANYWIQAEVLSKKEIANSLFIAAMVIAFRFFETIYRGSLYGLQRQVLANIVAAIMATLRAGGSLILLVFFAVDIEMFFVWQAAVSAFTILVLAGCVYTIIPKAYRGGRFSVTTLLSVWRFALGMLTISLLSIIATQGDKLLLSKLIPLEEFGFYVFAAKVASIVMIVSSPVLSAIYPKLVQHVNQGDQVQLISTLHRFSKIVVSLTAPIAAVLSLFAESVIIVWTGDQKLAASVSPFLSVIVLGTFLHAQCVLPYQVQLAYGWTSLSIWTNFVGVILLILSISFLVPLYGPISAAWTWVALTAIYFFVAVNFSFCRYVTGERFVFYIYDVGIPAIIAFVVAYSMNLLMPVREQSRVVMLIFIFCTLCGAFALTSFAAFCLGRMSVRRSKE